MTSLRKRLDNVLTELAIIRESLDKESHYPSCCLTFHKDGKTSCDFLGPLPQEEFMKECRKCRMHINKMLARVNLDLDKVEG